MRVAPEPEFLFAGHVLVADVKAADEADVVVDHNDFAVQPVVQPKIGDEVLRGKVGFRLGPSGQQRRPELFVCAKGTPGVVKDQDLDALLGFLDQQVPELVAQLVVVKGVILHKDVVRRRFDVFKKLGKLFFAVEEQVD